MLAELHALQENSTSSILSQQIASGWYLAFAYLTSQITWLNQDGNFHSVQGMESIHSIGRSLIRKPRDAAPAWVSWRRRREGRV